MKKYIKLISMLLFLSLMFSCEQKSKENMIVGKWNFEDAEFSKMTSQNNITLEEVGQLSVFKDTYKQMSIEFFKDNTYDTKMPANMKEEQSNGTYRLEGDGKYLVTEANKESGSGKPKRIEIKKLTQDSLVLNTDDNVLILYMRSK